MIKSDSKSGNHQIEKLLLATEKFSITLQKDSDIASMECDENIKMLENDESHPNQLK